MKGEGQGGGEDVEAQMRKRTKKASWIVAVAVLAGLLTSCANTSSGPTGTSVSGYDVAVRVIPDTVPADSASQATVRVEVRDAYGNFVSGASVVLTATMGTLGGSSVTTTNGVATTTFTSGSKTGTGQIAATVENVTVVGKVSLTAVKTK